MTCVGVVDFLVETVEATVLAVGEVKPETSADCQVLAPLLALRSHRKGCITFQKKIYMTQKLTDVIGFLDHLLALAVETEKQQPQVTERSLSPGMTERGANLCTHTQKLNAANEQWPGFSPPRSFLTIWYTAKASDQTPIRWQWSSLPLPSVLEKSTIYR